MRRRRARDAFPMAPSPNHSSASNAACRHPRHQPDTHVPTREFESGPDVDPIDLRLPLRDGEAGLLSATGSRIAGEDRRFDRILSTAVASGPSAQRRASTDSALDPSSTAGSSTCRWVTVPSSTTIA